MERKWALKSVIPGSSLCPFLFYYNQCLVSHADLLQNSIACSTGSISRIKVMNNLYSAFSTGIQMRFTNHSKSKKWKQSTVTEINKYLIKRFLKKIGL